MNFNVKIEGTNLLMAAKAADGGHSVPSMENIHQTSCDLPYRPLISGRIVRIENQSVITNEHVTSIRNKIFFIKIMYMQNSTKIRHISFCSNNPH